MAAERLPRALRLGTSSWSFPGWAGVVYDRTVSETVLARHGLAAYARHPLLRTVGIDRTYYRPIPAEEFRGYADAVPDDFRFLVKADRLAHLPDRPGALLHPRAQPPLPRRHLGDRRGDRADDGGSRREGGPPPLPVLPHLAQPGRRPRAFAERLHRFLDALPPGPRYAVELRTPALLTADYAAALEATGSAHCYTVHPAMASLEEQLTAVRHYEQPVLLIRWMLHAGLQYEAAKDRYAPFDRIQDEDPQSLERIAVAALDALIAERDVFVVANNKAEGSAPLSVFRLATRMASWEARP